MTNEANIDALARYGPGGGAVYLGDDDHLRVTTFSSTSTHRLGVDARVLARDGELVPIQQDVGRASTRLAVTTIVHLRAGYLLGGQVRIVSGTAGRGQCYVRVELVRGRTGDVVPMGLMGQGYVHDHSSLRFPGVMFEDSTSGRGNIRTVIGTNPAAGVEISETVPTGARWRLISLRNNLTTDVTVANRVPRFTPDDGANLFAQWAATVTQTASTTVGYCWSAVGAQSATSVSDAPGYVPPDLFLPAGYRLKTTTSGFQAGDDWATTVLHVEEWLAA